MARAWGNSWGNSWGDSWGTVDVSAALTGLPAAPTQGVLTPVVEVVLTGLSATATQGVLTPSQQLTGLSATTTQGVLTPVTAVDITLTGYNVTASGGSFGVALDALLVGEDAATSIGTMGPLATGDAFAVLDGLRLVTRYGYFVFVRELGGTYALYVTTFPEEVFSSYIPKEAVAFTKTEELFVQ